MLVRDGEGFSGVLGIVLLFFFSCNVLCMLEHLCSLVVRFGENMNNFNSVNVV
jgi:hypothetical protein